MKNLVIFFALIFSFTACSKSHDDTILNDVDIEFMQQISYANYAATDEAALALTNGYDASVKSFAQNILTTQPGMQNNLTAIATSLNVQLPSETDSTHKAITAYLATLHGHTFDDAYINTQATDYTTTILLYDTELSKGNNAQVIIFARTYLPVIINQSDEASGL